MNTDFPTEEWAVGPVPGREEADAIGEDPFARPMFWVALANLLFFAVLIHRWDPDVPSDTFEQAIVTGWIVTWTVIMGEAVFRWVLLSAFRWVELSRGVLYALLPPMRMGAPSLLRPNQIWFPFLGWRRLGKRLPDTLRTAFAGPMILFAVLVIPLVLIEYFKAAEIARIAWLRAAVLFAAAAIWLAFALEFILKVSVAKRTFSFLVKSWLDLAIVLIPTLTFLFPIFAKSALAGRLMRMSRAFNPAYLSKMGRLYRLRGLGGRAWASVLTLDLLARAMGKDPDKSALKRAQKREARLLEDLGDIRELMADLRKKIAKKQAELIESDA